MGTLAIDNKLPPEPATIDERRWSIKHNKLARLLDAARANDKAISKALKHGESLLHVCSRDGAEEAVQTLINLSWNVNYQDKFGQTPLFTAIQYGHYEICDLLLNAGAKVNHLDMNKNTPLIAAITSEIDHSLNLNIKIIELLLKHGAKINQPNDIGDTPLKIALEEKRMKIARFLIDNKGTIENE